MSSSTEGRPILRASATLEVDELIVLSESRLQSAVCEREPYSWRDAAADLGLWVER